MSDHKHFHVYRPVPSDRPGPPRIFATDGIGYWSRSDAKLSARKVSTVRGQRPKVVQCVRTDCMMKEPYADRDDQLVNKMGDSWERVENDGRVPLIRRKAALRGSEAAASV